MHITSIKLSDGSWHGTAMKAYILHCMDQMHCYEKLEPNLNNFPNPVKLTMLQNVVNNTKALSIVHTTALQIESSRARSASHKLTYQSYCGHLISAGC